MINSKKYTPEEFSKEVRANLRYLAFAALAEKEGFPQIAALFRATARAETVPVAAHLRVPGPLGAAAAGLRVFRKADGRG